MQVNGIFGQPFSNASIRAWTAFCCCCIMSCYDWQEKEFSGGSRRLRLGAHFGILCGWENGYLSMTGQISSRLNISLYFLFFYFLIFFCLLLLLLLPLLLLRLRLLLYNLNGWLGVKHQVTYRLFFFVLTWPCVIGRTLKSNYYLTLLRLLPLLLLLLLLLLANLSTSENWSIILKLQS